MSTSSDARGSQPLFVAGDLDGFFGLAVDNLIQFLLILGLCGALLGFPLSLLLQTILPGAALSILFGNFFYSYQAQKLSRQSGRNDITALPYGINTVSLFAFVLLVMRPVKLYAEAEGLPPVEASLVAWRAGLAACFLSGVIELLGSAVAERIRKATPRAALLSTLAGIAVSFIAIDFAIRTFRMPLVALLPLAVIIATYFSGIKMPFRIPGGAWAVGLGTASAWLLGAFPEAGDATPVRAENIAHAFDNLALCLPVPVLSDLIKGLGDPYTHRFFIPVILPMGLFNVLGSLQNIASIAPPPVPVWPSMAWARWSPRCSVPAFPPPFISAIPGGKGWARAPATPYSTGYFSPPWRFSALPL